MKRLKKLIAIIMVICLMIPATALAAAESPKAKDLSEKGEIVLTNRTFTYDGAFHKPEFSVVYGGKTLERGTDYNVTYANHRAVGTFSLKVTGIGKYTGVLKTTWKIKAASISSTKISCSNLTYNGKTQKPKVTVKFGGKTLKSGTDYTATIKSGKNAGSYSVTVKGKGNFSGTKKVTYKINKATQSKVTVSHNYKATKASKLKKKSKSFNITVKGVKDKAKVTYSSNSKKVTVNSKGKVTLKKGISKGTYKITVKVAATKNYKAYTKTISIKVK